MLERYTDTKFIAGRIKYYQEQSQILRQAYDSGERIRDSEQFRQRLDYLLLDILEDSVDLALAYDSTQMESSKDKIKFWSKTLDGMRYSLRMWIDRLEKNF